MPSFRLCLFGARHERVRKTRVVTIPGLILPQTSASVMLPVYTRLHSITHRKLLNIETFYKTRPIREVRASNQSSRSFSTIHHQGWPSVGGGGDQDEPLRILYCGSDSFSSTSLQALYQESQRPSSNIASIDVVCRDGKPFGRGLKSIRHRTSSTTRTRSSAN